MELFVGRIKGQPDSQERKVQWFIQEAALAESRQDAKAHRSGCCRKKWFWFFALSYTWDESLRLFLLLLFTPLQ